MLIFRRILASLIVLYGLALCVGGAALVMAGGSPGFLLVGLGTATSGVLIVLGRFDGVLAYAAVLATAVVWSVLEVGFDPVQLAPRLAIAIVLGLGLVPVGLAARTG